MESKISIQKYYETFSEASRLQSPAGQLEQIRSQEILLRFLPEPPADILDVGGGSGPYTLWLAELGYRSHLLEPSPSLLSQARQAASRSASPPASLQAGDARSLPFGNDSMDAVLMFGPLYHLTDPSDRQQALQESLRVLREGGLLFAVGISRFAPLVDSLNPDFLKDDRFRPILQNDLMTGQHRNPTENMHYFTDAYLTLPDELSSEITGAGFRDVKIVPIQGVGVIAERIAEILSDRQLRSSFMNIVRMGEAIPWLAAITGHMMAVANK